MNPDETSIMFDINKVGEELSNNLNELSDKTYSFYAKLGSIENKSPDIIKNDLNEIIPSVNKMIDLLDPLATTPMPYDAEIKGQGISGYDGDAYKCFVAGIKVGKLLPELNAIKELKDVNNDELRQYDLDTFIWDVYADIEVIRHDLTYCRIFKNFMLTPYERAYEYYSSKHEK